MFLLGVGWMLYDMAALLWGAVGLFALLLWHVRQHHGPGAGRFLVLLAAVLCFVLGAGKGYVTGQQWQQYHLFLEEGGILSFQGEIYKIQKTSDGTSYYLQQVLLQRGAENIICPSVILTSVSEELPIGTIVIGKGEVTAFRIAVNEGNFDEKKYYESLGIAAKISATAIRKTYEPTLSMGQLLETLRSKMRSVYEQCLPGEESGVMATIALGDKSILEAEAKSLYQLSGLAHILAISGLHISVIGMGIYNLLRKRGWGFGTSGITAATVLYLYALMSGSSCSVRRAVFMFWLYLAAAWLGRTYDSLCALAAAAGVLIWQQPMLLTNSGFLFSFGCVLGVVSVCKKVMDAHEKIAFLLLPVMLQLFTLPMMAYFYYEIPIYSVFLNLLLLPLLSPLLALGLVGGLLGIWQLFLGRLLLLPCHLILYGYEMLADLSLKLPGARQITGCPALWRIGVYYGALYLLVYGLDHRLKHRNGAPKRPIYVMRTMLLAALAVFLVLPAPSSLEIDILDVGQGDGIFIQSREGVTFFIDGGSTSVGNVGTYRILPFLKYKGIRHIDYWIVSHTDEDHISGLAEALDAGYSIKNLVLSATMTDMSEAAVNLQEQARSRGCQVLFLSRGDRISTDSLHLDCLYPEAEPVFDGTNENSLVLQLSAEHISMLFTGDISGEQESYLLQKGWLTSVDLLKVAHHGSKNSSSLAFLQQVSPVYALISAGKGNSYGHPSPETLQRLAESGTEAYCTMDTGQIRITEEEGNPVLQSFLGSDEEKDLNTY
jgi:competence protein ComEC